MRVCFLDAIIYYVALVYVVYNDEADLLGVRQAFSLIRGPVPSPLGRSTKRIQYATVGFYLFLVTQLLIFLFPYLAEKSYNLTAYTWFEFLDNWTSEDQLLLSCSGVCAQGIDS